MKYTASVGYKFNEDGSAMPFPGATIISFLPQTHPVFGEMLRIAQQARQAAYSHKFTFLPPASYHMTNKVLYNDHPSDREGPGWSEKYPRDLSCAELDASLARDLLRIVQRGDWPQSFRMRLWYVDNNSLKLQPATTRCADELRHFRDAVAQETGIRWPDHEKYVYHMTYAYRLQELSEGEAEEFRQLTLQQAALFRRQFPEFDLPAGVFCTFCDMTHFEPYPLDKYDEEPSNG